MATGTAWYNLTKPASTENYNLNVWNTNLDMIDEQMHQNETTSFTGATELANGTVGNVPAPTTADKDKFLKGDGTWAEAGSSNVEANPSGTPTETLETIGIDNAIYQLPEGGDTEITGDAEGSVISIHDGNLNEPLKACTVDINPVQSGSGTPSPSNIRPISGWTEANITVAGKNLFKEKFSDYFNSTAYSYYYLPKNQALNISFEDKDTSIDISDISVGFAYNYTNGAATNYRWSILNGVISSNLTNITNRGDYGNALIIYPKNETTFNKLKARYNIKVTIGSYVESYTPYVGTTTTIPLGQTVYGGTLDTVSGVLTVTDGYIASYDGETLPSTWISDRDVYASGTTPTTGAEVVYKLATPTEISLTPTEITTLYGKNVIWADSGDIAITYVRDISIAINDALNQSITPTYSSGTKIADYNIGGHTGAIYVQGAGGHMDTLWTGNETPTMSYNPTITLSHPISDYDFLLVNFNIDNGGGNHLKTTVTLYGVTVGDKFAQEFLLAQNSAMCVNVINDYNINLECYGRSYENTTYVSIIGVKL